MGNSADTTVKTYHEPDGSVLIKRVQQAPYNSDGWWPMQSVLNLDQCNQFDITEIRYKLRANKFPHRWGIGIAEYDIKNDKIDLRRKAGVDFVDAGIAFDTLNVNGKQFGINAQGCRDKLVGVVLNIASAKLHFFYEHGTSWKNICSLDLERNKAYKMIIRLPAQNDGVIIQDRSIWNQTTRRKNNALKVLRKTHDELIKQQREMENMENIFNKTLKENKQETFIKMKQQNQEIKTMVNCISQQQATVKSIQKQMQSMENILNKKLETITNKQITLSNMQQQQAAVKSIKKQIENMEIILNRTLEENKEVTVSKMKQQNQEIKSLMKYISQQQATVKSIQKQLQNINIILNTKSEVMDGEEYQNTLKKIHDAVKKNESVLKQITYVAMMTAAFSICPTLPMDPNNITNSVYENIKWRVFVALISCAVYKLTSKL